MNENNKLNYSLNMYEMLLLNPDAEYIIYTELNKISDLEELFKNTNKIIILYLLQNEYSGHYVCLFKYKNDFQFFSSYGVEPDEELSVLTKKKRIELDEKQDRLKLLCGKYKVYYSLIRFQKAGTQTCGCFVTHRLSLSNLNDEEYFKFYIKNKIKNPDLFVADYCLDKLNELKNNI